VASLKYEHSERRRELKRLWHQQNKEKQNSRSLRYYANHKDECISQSSAWRLDHLDFSKQRDKERYQSQREEQIKRAIQWRKENPDKARDYNLNHKLKNKEKQKSQSREWHRKNRHLRLFYGHKYRALKRKYAHNLKQIKEYFLRVRSKPTFTCYYCEKTIPSSMVHFDHIFPLSKGGHHAVENLCTSCRSCNSSKRDKLLGIWIKRGQQVFAL